MTVPAWRTVLTLSGFHSLLPVEYRAVPLTRTTVAFPCLTPWAATLETMASAMPQTTNALTKLRIFIYMCSWFANHINSQPLYGNAAGCQINIHLFLQFISGQSTTANFESGSNWRSGFCAVNAIAARPARQARPRPPPRACG